MSLKTRSGDLEDINKLIVLLKGDPSTFLVANRKDKGHSRTLVQNLNSSFAGTLTDRELNDKTVAFVEKIATEGAFGKGDNTDILAMDNNKGSQIQVIAQRMAVQSMSDRPNYEEYYTDVARLMMLVDVPSDETSKSAIQGDLHSSVSKVMQNGMQILRWNILGEAKCDHEVKIVYKNLQGDKGYDLAYAPKKAVNNFYISIPATSGQIFNVLHPPDQDKKFVFGNGESAKGYKFVTDKEDVQKSAREKTLEAEVRDLNTKLGQMKDQLEAASKVQIMRMESRPASSMSLMSLSSLEFPSIKFEGFDLSNSEATVLKNKILPKLPSTLIDELNERSLKVANNWGKDVFVNGSRGDKLWKRWSKEDKNHDADTRNNLVVETSLNIGDAAMIGLLQLLKEGGSCPVPLFCASVHTAARWCSQANFRQFAAMTSSQLGKGMTMPDNDKEDLEEILMNMVGAKDIPFFPSRTWISEEAQAYCDTDGVLFYKREGLPPGIAPLKIFTPSEYIVTEKIATRGSMSFNPLATASTDHPLKEDSDEESESDTSKKTPAYKKQSGYNSDSAAAFGGSKKKHSKPKKRYAPGFRPPGDTYSDFSSLFGAMGGPILPIRSRTDFDAQFMREQQSIEDMRKQAARLLFSDRFK